MVLRAGHGAGKGKPRIEVLPPDELPPPVAALQAADTGPINRRPGGQIADPETAKTLGKMGGEAKARRVRLIDSLGLTSISTESTFAPYRTAAEEFTKHHLGELAGMAGGSVGSGPSTFVCSAALQLAASRWAFDAGAATGDAGLLKLGSALANDSRQNLLAAYEYATREAESRRRAPSANTAEALRARILGKRKESP
jgi:hypothetical protein